MFNSLRLPLEELAEIYLKTSDFVKDALESVENNDLEKAQAPYRTT